MQLMGHSIAPSRWRPPPTILSQCAPWAAQHSSSATCVRVGCSYTDGKVTAWAQDYDGELLASARALEAAAKAAAAAGADTEAVPAGVTFFFDGEPMAGKADKIEAMFAADAQLSFIGAYAPPMPPPGFLDLEHIKVSAGGLPPPLLRASTAP
eukprot:COSAG01_NODE_5923_length_3949_cov_100.549091_1_plen_152_part_10